MNEITKIWKCAWHEGDYWFDHKQGEVHPEIIPLFPSHGICEKCLAKQKAILAAMKESNNFPAVEASGVVLRTNSAATEYPLNDGQIAVRRQPARPGPGADRRTAGNDLRPGNSVAGEPPTSIHRAELNTQGESTPIDFNHFGAA